MTIPEKYLTVEDISPLFVQNKFEEIDSSLEEINEKLDLISSWIRDHTYPQEKTKTTEDFDTIINHIENPPTPTISPELLAEIAECGRKK